MSVATSVAIAAGFLGHSDSHKHQSEEKESNL
jgi:hypothetical protein